MAKPKKKDNSFGSLGKFPSTTADQFLWVWCQYSDNNGPEKFLSCRVIVF